MRRRQKLAEAVRKRPLPPPVRDIRAEYEARFGKPPHGRMKPETIEARLRDDDTCDKRA